MIIAHVSVTVKDEMIDEFERTAREIVEAARQTKGCIKNEWYPVPADSRRYDFYGEFDSQANFAEYRKSAVVKRIGDELVPLLVAPPEFKHYKATILESS